MLVPPFEPQVAAVFSAYRNDVRLRLLALRKLIFSVAAETDGVGELDETLKWSQPSYLTLQSKSGSTIRVDQIRSKAGAYAMYVICHTNLVETFEQMYEALFAYDGNRALLFDVQDEIPYEALSHYLSLSLTYHLREKG